MMPMESFSMRVEDIGLNLHKKLGGWKARCALGGWRGGSLGGVSGPRLLAGGGFGGICGGEKSCGIW